MALENVQFFSSREKMGGRKDLILRGGGGVPMIVFITACNDHSAFAQNRVTEHET